MCSDGSDQINCTNSDIKFSCEERSSGYTISLTDMALCQDLDICQDDINNKCVTPETNCIIHRHFRCDGVAQCDNGLDEEHCEDLRTHMVCVRRVRNRGLSYDSRTAILKEWVMDGVRDCEGDEDENEALWKVCKYGDQKISYNIPHLPCMFVFVCNPTASNPELLNPTKMCNGIGKELCPIEATLCKISRRKGEGNEAVKFNATHKYILPCVPGSNKSDCVQHNFLRSYGTLPTIISAPPAGILDCRELTGENYVYMSCLGLCNDSSVTCPITDIHFTKSCPKLESRTLTLTLEGKLTFVTSTGTPGEFINQEIFPCQNGNCVPYSKVCDLINDCGDNSDEELCLNHFACDDKGSEIVRRDQFCDGAVDCSNFADECNTDCPSQLGKKIVTSPVLQAFGWLIGIPATMMNTYMIVSTVRGNFLKRERNSVTLATSTMITLVAVGDLCIGLYLVGISIENLIHYEDFCKWEMEWLTSFRCEGYGVLSTFGSELSVLTMTLLSVYRAHVVKKREVRHMRSRSSTAKLAVACIGIVMVALLIAVLPTIQSLREAYFYNGYFIENAPLFLGSKRRDEFIPILEEYFGEAEMQEHLKNSLKIRTKVQEMFLNPDDPNGTNLKFNVLGFYGSSGSCTFKFFVDPKDPQKMYTWFILVLNLVCLLVMAAAYSSVWVNSRSTASSSLPRNRTSALHRKITFIILTDFICWFPFLVVCILHYTGLLDAQRLYPTFATILLPVNAIINPVLYDKTLSRGLSHLNRYIRDSMWAESRTNRRVSDEGRGLELSTLSRAVLSNNVSLQKTASNVSLPKT